MGNDRTLIRARGKRAGRYEVVVTPVFLQNVVTLLIDLEQMEAHSDFEVHRLARFAARILDESLK